MSNPTGPNSTGALPAICLNMIVRNEAHIVHQVLDCVAPYISYWVIVDTGSDDGTQDVIRSHMADLAIPGELHERPWQNFGVNRSQALALAQGCGDFIWVIDADDLVMGTPDFSNLTADAYELGFGDSNGITVWRPQVFRDGLPWRYLGVTHEYVSCSQPLECRRIVTERTLNSFLNTCLDRSRIGRFLVVDAGLWAEDRAILLEKYRFLEFIRTPATEQPGDRLAHLQREIGGQFWLHLDEGWQFFAQESYISRLTGVLAAEPDVYQVAINFEDAVAPTGCCAAEDTVRRTEQAGRYVLTDTVASGPAMFAMARIGKSGAGLRTATLDEVLCLAPLKQV